MLRYEASILHADIECGRFFTIVQNDKGDLGVACGPGCSGLRFAPALLRRAKPLPSLTRNFAALRQLHLYTSTTKKSKTSLSESKIIFYLCGVNQEVSYFNSATCCKGAWYQANQPNNHSIFFANDLLHQITGSIITG